MSSDDEIQSAHYGFLVSKGLLGVRPAGYYARRGPLDQGLAGQLSGS
jgi:hypothetical protein